MKNNPRVALFVTCLVDLFRPAVGFSAIKLLEDSGCAVEIPVNQTCCGQPAYNSGDRKDAKAIATQVIENFEDYDYIVAPSGSCAAMLKKHYPGLFADDPEWVERSKAFAQKVFELVSFLVDVRKVEKVSASLEKTVTYHDSCSGLRELGVQSQPRKLLSSVKGLKVAELVDSDVCCGFGGTFCVKYSDISNSIVSKKTDNISKSGAEVLLAGDLGCLMNMAGKLHRQGSEIEVRHVAEVLSGQVSNAPIGGSKR